MSKELSQFDLEERLLMLPYVLSEQRNHYQNQKLEIISSANLFVVELHLFQNFGETQSAESQADFIHNMKISLKELRETRVWLLIIIRANLIKEPSKLDSVVDENNQLISIFVTSIKLLIRTKRKLCNSIFLVRYSIFVFQ